ncbi:MAG: kynureninase [Candidatus Dormibacteraceae bacterium]
MSAPGREACLEMDRQDPLGALRDEFWLDASVIYLDGNSLGAPSRAAHARVVQALGDEWGRGLIRSWDEAGWADAPARLGDRLGRILGAAPGEVAVTDSTTVNLYKLLVAALEASPDRAVILSEQGNFPTDLYIAEGIARLRPGVEVRLVERDQIASALDGSVAVLLLSHVDYRLGRLHDMEALTGAAHRAGALALWDLSHSAGAVPVELDAWQADMAVGCTYKYLNGGPGSPALLYVAGRLQSRLRSPVNGWFGHAHPFRFDASYVPAPGIERWLAGTPPILACAALEGALEIWDHAGIEAAREKSLRLGDLMIELADARLARWGVTVASPRAGSERGSQVSLAHPEAGPLMRALIERGVIGDVRPPNLMRFGFPALYTRFVDVHDAVDRLEEILNVGAHRQARFQVGGRVP